ncbi:uncharacterized protein LOC124493063 [Dermatophagoides farinae]|uniref:uncharacterized protein LOC124493063 n=1 Tax=Dermatophagoides farinae TaxID=6954 RepID=UPI003F5F6BF5
MFHRKLMNLQSLRIQIINNQTKTDDVLQQVDAENKMIETPNENLLKQKEEKVNPSEQEGDLKDDKINDDKVAADSTNNLISQSNEPQKQTVEPASKLPDGDDSDHQQNNIESQQENIRTKRDSSDLEQQSKPLEGVEENNNPKITNVHQSSVSFQSSIVSNDSANDNDADLISSHSPSSSQPLAADIPHNLHQQVHVPAHHHHNQQTNTENPNVSNQAPSPPNADFSKTNDDQLIEQNVKPTIDSLPGNTQQVNTHLHPKLLQRPHVESADDLKSAVNVDQNNPPSSQQHHSGNQKQIQEPSSIDYSTNSNAHSDYHQSQSSNFHAEGSVLNSKHKPFAENRNIPQAPPVDNSVVSQSVLVNPVVHSEQYQQPVNNNIFKRKLLAERVGFVSVIMEIIPDEVELFFESFNISLHAIIFTSIVGFFWCLMKVLIFFISSSKKVRELQDTICQTQRKLYYFEAEKDKIKEEYVVCRDESSSFKDNLHRIEKRKYLLEQENEKLKTEIMNLKKDNSSLKIQAESNPIMSSKLDQVLSEVDRFKQENHELCSKIVELETQIDTHLLTIKQQERTARSDKEEIDNLNDQLVTLNEEIEKLNETIKELEQQFTIVQSENTNLKESQHKLNEEIKDMKDELLSCEEKVKNFENECKSLEKQLKTANEKVDSFLQELEIKNSEIISMQTLLNKLNKNMTKNKEHDRQRRSTDLNGDLTIGSVNGDDGVDQNVVNNNTNEQTSGGEDAICLQDVVQLQLRLTQMEVEKEQLRQKFEALQKQMKDINDEIESTREINQQLKQNAENALQEKFKAVTELEVLSKYYKEKELEYAKDIGVHKVKQEQQSEDVESLSSKLAVTEEENTILKDRLKSIKKELEETERRYKTQLNQLEKHSHENWIAARAAERKFEETKAEASALRQTLSQSVKSPPPGDLSFGGYLDDTASSVSSLPEVLNSSLPVPPPPPPPFPFSSLFASNIHPPPQIQGVPLPTSANLFDLNEQHNVAANSNTYWSSQSAAPTAVTAQGPVVHQAQSSISSNTSNTFAFDPSKSMPLVASTDISMAYPQVNPMSHHHQQQPQQSTHYGSTSSISGHQQPPSNHNIQQQYNTENSYGGHYQQQHSFHSSQLDLTRNTYSPAMSQRSTHTPLTTANMNSINYDMQRATPASQCNVSQPNPYGSPLQQHQPNPNPFSVNYSTTGYTQQQQPPPPTHDVYSNSHHHHHHHGQQLYNTGQQPQQQQQQQQPVIDPNNQHSYSSSTIGATYTNQPPISSQSRPQSVHNQMV